MEALGCRVRWQQLLDRPASKASPAWTHVCWGHCVNHCFRQVKMAVAECPLARSVSSARKIFMAESIKKLGPGGMTARASNSANFECQAAPESTLTRKNPTCLRFRTTHPCLGCWHCSIRGPFNMTLRKLPHQIQCFKE